MSQPRLSRRATATGRLAALIAVVVLLGTTLSVPVRNWFGQRAQIAALETELVDLTASVAELQILKERWEDPAFIAAQARRRLHFVMPGEVGFVALGEQVEASIDSPVEVPDASWHALLWQSVQEIDRGPDAT
jgi:cell division protein FtsB